MLCCANFCYGISCRQWPNAARGAIFWEWHHRFVSRKTSYLRRFFFSFVVTYLDCLMLLTTCSAEPLFINDDCNQTLCARTILRLLFQVRTKSFMGQWSGRTIIPGILVPRTNFFAGPKFPWQALYACSSGILWSSSVTLCRFNANCFRCLEFMIWNSLPCFLQPWHTTWYFSMTSDQTDMSSPGLVVAIYVEA